jgi:rhodanese-related sulfurtransferase
MSEAVPLEITCDAVKRKLDAGEDFFFLDCREPDEYATAKIAATTLIPMSQLADRVG